MNGIGSSQHQLAHYIHGANYAWRNYGEFGERADGAANRVANHREAIGADFAMLAAQGVTAVRWFLFTDGRNGIRFDGQSKLPAGLAPGVFDDMDVAVDIARRHGIRILFSALDFLVQFDTAHPEMLKSEQGRQAFMDEVMQPVLSRYGRDDAVLGWEVMNEPDYVTRGLSRVDQRATQPLNFDEFARFTRMFADTVHASTGALVTVGGALAKNAAAWDSDDLGLDFIQVHHYYRDRAKNDADLYGSPAASLQLKRRLLIGEVSGKNDGHDPPVALRDWLEFGLNAGYAGVWPWAFTKGDNDDHAPYDGGIMRQFAQAHPELSNPAALLPFAF